MGSLEGKVALVTGGASGIGRAVVERLARDGASVAVVDVDEDGGTEVAQANNGSFIPADVREPAQMQAAVDRVTETHGRLDIVHLNAGIATGESEIGKLTVDTYRRAAGINIDGVVFGAMAAVPVMSDGGRLVATASLAGLVAYPGDPIYALTKHAVVGFVRSLAEQLGPRGITVNAICPGFTDTAILGDYAEDFRRANFPLLSTDEVADSVAKIVASLETGQVFVCQPGRTFEPYRFRGVPGPRVPGSEGMPPPVEPGVDAPGSVTTRREG